MAKQFKLTPKRAKNANGTKLTPGHGGSGNNPKTYGNTFLQRFRRD